MFEILSLKSSNYEILLLTKFPYLIRTLNPLSLGVDEPNMDYLSQFLDEIMHILLLFLKFYAYFLLYYDVDCSNSSRLSYTGNYYACSNKEYYFEIHYKVNIHTNYAAKII